MKYTIITRPLRKHLPKPPPGSILQTCSRCHEECWELPKESKQYDLFTIGLRFLCTPCGKAVTNNEAQ